MPRITRYLYPQIKRPDLLPIFSCAIIGALLAGSFGALHDQLTYALSPEYFTTLKFRQFRYADLGFGNLVFVSTIGFLATWWLGLFLGWFVGRRYVPDQRRSTAARNVTLAFATTLATTVCFETAAGLYGLSIDSETLSDWSAVLTALDVADKYHFIQVVYVHNAGYVGALTGVVLAMIVIRPMRDQSFV